jgi:hypothetical protein
MHLLDWFMSKLAEHWVEYADSPAATVTATHAAVTGKQHVIVTVDASFKTSTTDGQIRLFDGTTEIASKYIHGAGAIDFGESGHPCTKGNLVQAILTGGSGTESGAITMNGFSVTPG